MILAPERAARWAKIEAAENATILVCGRTVDMGGLNLHPLLLVDWDLNKTCAVCDASVFARPWQPAERVRVCAECFVEHKGALTGAEYRIDARSLVEIARILRPLGR